MLTTNDAATEAARQALRALGCVLPRPAVAEVLNVALPLIEDAGEQLEQPPADTEWLKTESSRTRRGRGEGPVYGSPGHIRGGEGVAKPERPPSGPSPVGVLDAEALHRREMIEGGPRPLDRLTQQIAGLADTVIRSEGRLADRVADLARLVVELRVADQPLEAALERTEPTEADLWQAALGMAAAQRDRKSLDGARVLREALWFLRQLQDGPPADDEIDDDPEPAGA